MAPSGGCESLMFSLMSICRFSSCSTVLIVYSLFQRARTVTARGSTWNKMVKSEHEVRYTVHFLTITIIISKFKDWADGSYHSCRCDAVHVNPGAKPDGGCLVGVLWAAGQLQAVDPALIRRLESNAMYWSIILRQRYRYCNLVKWIWLYTTDHL